MARKRRRRKKTPSGDQKRPESLVSIVARELDLAEDLARIEADTFDPSAITFRQRRLFLLLMRDRHSQVALAAKFGVCRRTIQKDLDAIRRSVAEAIDVDVLVGDLVLAGDTLAERALEQGDVATAWKITKERIQLLLDLGYLRREVSTGPSIHEMLAEGYKRFRAAVESASDPVLTGEVVEPPGEPGRAETPEQSTPESSRR